MKIKHFTLGLLLFAIIMAFFAFYIPGAKISATTSAYTGLNCASPPLGLCKSFPRPELINGKEVFNSTMYINKKGKLVIEFIKEYLNDSLRINYFEKGYYDVEVVSRLNDKELLAALGVTDSVLVVPKGRYPVRKGWGKYIVTFEEMAKEDSQSSGK
jgi:hypothetical protein